MLQIGLTGGIAAGKSLVSARLAELGAVIIDADRIAREVVEPGTPGLAAVAAEFGPGVINADGSLDRAALGAVVFADEGRLAALNAMVHPLVRREAARLKEAAGPADIVVQDIPLLVETGQGDAFHLVVVVEAPEAGRIARMVRDRGMGEDAARARIAAQASDAQRRVAADVVLENAGTPDQVLAAVDALWERRLVPFTRNLAAGACAVPSGPPVLAPYNPQWPVEAARLAGRIRRAAGDAAVGVDHIGSTSVPGLPAKDVIDLQLRVPSLARADAVAGALADAGFPARAGDWSDTGHGLGGGREGERWEKRFHNAADPGRPVNLHVRVDGSPGALMALAFRDWLRADAHARDRYAAHKAELAQAHAGDNDTAGYAAAKEPWFAAAVPAVRGWVERAAQ